MAKRESRQLTRAQERQIRKAQKLAKEYLEFDGPADDGRLVFTLAAIFDEPTRRDVRERLKRAGYSYGSLRDGRTILRGWFK